MRFAAGLLATALVLAAMVGVATTPALACTEDEPPSEDLRAARLIDHWYGPDNQLVFVGQTIAREPIDDVTWSFTYSVTEMVVGPPLEEVEVLLRLTSAASCGIEHADRVPTGVRLVNAYKPHPDAAWHLAYIPGDASMLETINGLRSEVKQPLSTEPAEFIVSQQRTPQHLALVDARGQPVAYAEGEGAVEAVAPCPGNVYVGIIVRPSPFAPETFDDKWRLQLWRLDGLALVSEVELDPPTRLEYSDVVALHDFTCHGSAGEHMTYLWSSHDNGPNGPIPRGAEIHVARSGAIDIIEVEAADSLAVDADRSVAYTIDADDRTRFVEWDLETGEPTQHQLGREWIGWDIATIPDGVRLLVANRPGFWEHGDERAVNLIVAGPPDSLSSHRLRAQGELGGVVPGPDGSTWAHVGFQFVRIDADHDADPTFGAYQVNNGIVGSSGLLRTGSRHPNVSFASFDDLAQAGPRNLDPPRIEALGSVDVMASLVPTVNAAAADEARNQPSPSWEPSAQRLLRESEVGSGAAGTELDAASAPALPTTDSDRPDPLAFVAATFLGAGLAWSVLRLRRR